MQITCPIASNSVISSSLAWLDIPLEQNLNLSLPHIKHYQGSGQINEFWRKIFSTYETKSIFYCLKTLSDHHF